MVQKVYRGCFLFLPVFIWLILPISATAQTVPIGDLREDQLRLQQLLNDSLTTSFVHRPVWSRVYDTYMDAAEGRPGWWNRKLEPYEMDLGHGFSFGLFEPFLQSTINSHLPVGENNAAAWHGRGITSDLQGGFFITSEYATLTFRPQIVYQQNVRFRRPRFIGTGPDGERLFEAEAIGHRIDAPYRFGPDPFWTFDRGHSSVRIHYEQFEFGASSEPLWWGGAVHYPLMLSNNAPGVQHIFAGTRAPVRIPWFGEIEFNWMMGWPEDSEWFVPRQPVSERFINAINFSWSPAPLPGLYLGLTRAYIMQIPEGVSWEHIRIIFESPRTSPPRPDDPEVTGRANVDQAASIYLRWLFPRANAEIYGEFFREDHSYDFRDFLMQPHHNSGYSFGFQKIFFVPRLDFLKMNMEATNLTPSRLDEVRWQTYYYTHSRILQGHTNRGQVLGAAIGPASSSFYLSLDGYKDDYQVGIFGQRWVENDHFHYRFNTGQDRPWGDGDIYYHRVNLNLGVRALWGPGPFYLQGKLMWTKAFNYGRYEYSSISGMDWGDRVRDDEHNIQFQLSIRYLF